METSVKERNRRGWTAWALEGFLWGGWDVGSTWCHRWSTDGGVAYERWRTSPSILPTECVHNEGPRMGYSYGLSSPTWESSPGLVRQPWPPRCPIPTLRSWEKSPLTKRILCHGSARVSPWEDSAWKSFSQQEAPFLPKETGGKWYSLSWGCEHLTQSTLTNLEVQAFWKGIF